MSQKPATYTGPTPTDARLKRLGALLDSAQEFGTVADAVAMEDRALRILEMGQLDELLERLHGSYAALGLAELNADHVSRTRGFVANLVRRAPKAWLLAAVCSEEGHHLAQGVVLTERGQLLRMSRGEVGRGRNGYTEVRAPTVNDVRFGVAREYRYADYDPTAARHEDFSPVELIAAVERAMQRGIEHVSATHEGMAEREEALLRRR